MRRRAVFSFARFRVRRQAVTTPNNTDNEGDDASKREEGRAIEEMKKGRAGWLCEAGKKRGKKAEARDGGDGYRPFVWWRAGNAKRRWGGSVDAAAGATSGGPEQDSGRGALEERKGERIAGRRD